MKETDWFSLTVLPVRVGVYKTRHRGSDGKIYVGYSYWNGSRWGYKQSQANYAYFPNQHIASQQSREWKGIYKETS